MADATTEAPAASATPASTVAPTAAPESTTAVAATSAATTEAAAATAASTKEAPKGDDAATAAAKAAADAAKVPAEYADFKLPDGVTMPPEAFTEFKATAKELGLTQDQAQKVAELGVKQAQTFATQLATAQQEAVEKWAADTKADKEIGGDKLPENLAVAKKALDTFGSPELKTLLNKSGLGNNPEVIRFFVKAGKAISEDRIVTGAAGQKSSDVPIENRIYKDMK